MTFDNCLDLYETLTFHSDVMAECLDAAGRADNLDDFEASLDGVAAHARMIADAIEARRKP